MTTINLKEFFYWYKADEYIEVTDEVAEELRADKRYEVTHHRRMKRNKANYSLDADDGIEYAACEFEPSPEMALDLMEQYRRHRRGGDRVRGRLRRRDHQAGGGRLWQYSGAARRCGPGGGGGPAGADGADPGRGGPPGGHRRGTGPGRL